MQMHYWQKGLKNKILDLTAFEHLTKRKYIDIADAQNAALSVGFDGPPSGSAPPLFSSSCRNVLRSGGKAQEGQQLSA